MENESGLLAVAAVEALCAPAVVFALFFLMGYWKSGNKTNAFASFVVALTLPEQMHYLYAKKTVAFLSIPFILFRKELMESDDFLLRLYAVLIAFLLGVGYLGYRTGVWMHARNREYQKILDSEGILDRG